MAKRPFLLGAAIIGAAILTACGGPQETTASVESNANETDTGISETTAAASDTVSDQTGAETATRTNPNRGRILFLQCRSCHTLEADGPHLVGPNLNGMFGSIVGTKEGFVYSQALQDADFEWTTEALDAWLTRPTDFLPGNKMSFAGVRAPEDRALLIQYLQEETR